MHEAGLMRAAIAALTEASAGRPVKTVVLAVNDHVDLESAATTWRAAATGTCLEGAILDWQRAVDRLRCFTCGHEYNGQPLDLCPSCGGSGLVVSPADEMTVLDWAM